MRCWSTPDGGLLVEEKEGVFLLLNDGGEAEAYASREYAVQEYMYREAYAVEGDELRCELHSASDGGHSTTTRTVELRGLQPASSGGVEARIRKLREAQAAAGRSWARSEEDRLASFSRSLPELPGDLDFVFTYEQNAIVVRGPGGSEIWREPDAPHSGRHRFTQFRKLLQQRYGARLRSFKPVLPDMDAAMLFDPA